MRTSDGGLLLILIATGLAWRSARRGAGGPSRAVAVLSALLLVAYVVDDLGDDGEARLTPALRERGRAGGREPARLKLDDVAPLRGALDATLDG